MADGRRRRALPTAREEDVEFSKDMADRDDLEALARAEAADARQEAGGALTGGERGANAAELPSAGLRGQSAAQPGENAVSAAEMESGRGQG